MDKDKKLHFVGIGGAGMSGLAHICLAEGYEVTGSDLRGSRNVSRLQSLGAKIHFPHSGDHVQKDSIVVVSSAIPETNEELGVARSLGLPIKKRAEVLGWFMEDRDGIAVAGCHGKTTSTSMISSILTRAGENPSTIVGGEASHVGGNAKFGTGKYLVAEADESDGSFLLLPAKYSLITNIDNDHLDHYGSFEGVLKAFYTFMEQTQEMVILCIDDPCLRKLKNHFPDKVITYGFSEDADYVVSDLVQVGLKTSFKIELSGGSGLDVDLTVPGAHNVLNAAGSIALCDYLGIEAEFLSEGLKDFEGVQRRFELVSDRNDVLVYDDYAHHPREVQATLAAARSLMETRSGKLVVCFQPHRYTRLKELFCEFQESFQDADFLYLAPVYAAGEIPLQGVSTRRLYYALNMDRSKVSLLENGSMEAYASKIQAELFPGDVLLTMGAGDITRLGRLMGSSNRMI